MTQFSYKDVKRYVQLVEESNVSELEIAQDGVTLRIKKELNTAPPHYVQAHALLQPSAVPPPASAPAAPPETVVEAPPVSSIGEKPVKELYEVKAPMVGTFYRRPAPEADPYVEIGDTVSAGKVLCIIEAMKLMNEIECDVSGKIAEICVESGQPVEYGTVLFRIES